MKHKNLLIGLLGAAAVTASLSSCTSMLIPGMVDTALDPSVDLYFGSGGPYLTANPGLSLNYTWAPGFTNGWGAPPPPPPYRPNYQPPAPPPGGGRPSVAPTPSAPPQHPVGRPMGRH